MGPPGWLRFYDRDAAGRPDSTGNRKETSGTLRFVTDAYFTTNDGAWFQPTGLARGPWDPDSCHAGPPTALMVRALEALIPSERLARLTVELIRPVPMAGFLVQAEIRKPGRSVTFSEAEILDQDRVYARAYAMHLRRVEGLECSTAAVDVPRLEAAMPGRFPIHSWPHGLEAFPNSVEVRYDPDGSQGEGGPTTRWMRTKVPILADEEPSPFQRISPLADCGNGVVCPMAFSVAVVGLKRTDGFAEPRCRAVGEE